MSAVTTEDLLARLRDTGLLPAEVLQRLAAEGASAREPGAVLRDLVERGLVTG